MFRFATASTFFLCLFLRTVGADTETFNRYNYDRIGVTPSAIGVAGPLAGYDGKALIFGGGANFPDSPPWKGGTKTYYSNVFASLDKGQWIEQQISLPHEMGYSAVVQTEKGLFCLGGETAAGPLDDAFILRFDTKTSAVTITELPRLPKPRTAASATVLGNRVYLLGGVTSDGFSDDVLSVEIDTVQRTWRTEPKLPQPLGYGVAVTQSDGERPCVYFLGGRCKKPTDETTTFSDTVYRFDPKQNIWLTECRIPTALSAGTGAAVGIYSIFLFGGDEGTFFNANERRQREIDRETDAERKTQLLTEKNRLLDEHSGFRREVLLYNTITKTWTTPFRADEGFPVTTVALPWQDDIGPCVVIPGGEVRPGVRGNQIDVFRVTRQTRFTVLDYAVLVLYMLPLLGLGYFFMKKQGTESDFFLGGGRLPWWAVGISIFATMLSSITFLSVPAKAFATDWRMFLYNLGVIMVVPIVIRYYVPYFRNLKLDTAYEFLERRFNRIVRYFASGLFVTFMVTRIAIVLFLPSLALNIATGLDVYFCILAMAIVTIIYCTMGGMEAVVWSDVIQGIVLVAGAILSLIVLIVYTDGGLFGFFEMSYGAGKLHTFDLRFDLTQPVFWVMMIGAFSNNIITYSSDQALVQRYMCGTEMRQTVRSVWLNGFLAIPVILVFFPIGTALFTYYRSHPGMIDAGLQNADAIYPLFIVNGLPPGISGIVIAAIFAAAMSTLSANINSAAAAIHADFVKQWFPDVAKRRQILIPQIAGIVVGLLGTLFALLLATWDIASLWDQFNTFLALLTGPVAGLFLMGIFSRRINGVGAIAGLLTSFILLVFIAALPPSTRPSFLLYGLIGMASAYLVGYVVSLAVGGPAKTIVFPSTNL